MKRQTETTVPANLAAERVVLGALIEDDGLLPEVMDAGLSVEDFMLSDHQRIFRAILTLREKKCPVDYITVAEQLGNHAEDYVVIASLIHGVVIQEDHVLYHVALIQKKARQRELLKLGEWLVNSVNDTTDPSQAVEHVLEWIERCR